MSERLPDERRPARSHDRRGRLSQLALESVEASEVPFDRVGELAARFGLAVGSEVLPEQRVQDVAREIERERLLQRAEPREVPGVSRLAELIERGVHAL